MVDAERISELVARILAPNPSMMTLSGTNSYLVGHRELIVIDPGPDIPEHVDAIVDAAASRGRLAFSLVTHHHGDHLPAALRLRDRVGAPIAGHPDLPRVDRPLHHEETISLEEAHLRALHTPGHTSDHTCFFLEEESALFTGDLIAGSGTVIVGDGPGDLTHYMDSLQLVAKLEARLHLPGHGPTVHDPAAKIREYIDHRQMREDQIVSALREGEQTVGWLVARLYADVSRELHAMAARNVRSHLDKLEHEGRVASAGDTWRLLAGRGAR